MLRPEIFLYESNPNLQDVTWANRVVSRKRQDWRQVVTTEYYRTNKAKLLSFQSLQRTVGIYFTDSQFLKNTKFKPLPIMEKLRNIIIDTARETGIKPFIKSIDPTAKKHKDQDLYRLQTKQKQQAFVNKQREKVGDGVPYQMEDKEFNGNVPEFDKMGLDASDESEVKFFFDTYYKLNYEGYAQSAVMSVLADNKAEEDIPRYVNDILAVKVETKQTYVSSLTGQIIVKYLQPNQVFAIFGNNRDASDAPVKGWERQIPVQELLNILGNKFNFERDWMQLIFAINYGSQTQFDGFIKGNVNYNINDVLNTSVNVDTPPVPGKERTWNLLNYDDMFTDTYNYKVFFGYIEWNQYCIHAEKRNKITGRRFTVDNSFVPSVKSQYEKEEWGYFKTLQSNYIATGATSQKLYNYGDVYMMQTKGNADEFACGTISITREEGLSAMDVADIYIDLANYAYYKMLWAIHRSKPDVWSWAYESIREVAMKMTQTVSQGANTPQKAGAFEDAINKLIKDFDSKLFMMHTYPIVDGKVVGGGGLPHTKIPGALDAIAIQLREIVLDWAEQQIGDKLGLAGLAAANVPNPRDPVKLNELYLRQSRAATGYIPRMIDAAFKHTANVTLQYIQDILNFKDTIAYKYLLNLIGDEAIEALASIGKEYVPHRFAIYATSYGLNSEKQIMLQEAAIAFENKLITFPEYQLIKAVEEPRVAAKISAFFQEKAERRKEKQIAAANTFQLQLSKEKDDRLFKLEEMKANKGIEKQRVQTDGYKYVADKEAQTKLQSKSMDGDNSQTKELNKLEGEKQIMNAKSNIDLQKDLIENS
jgi:hypothetical protein